jgi:hypothetical protein
MAPGASPPTRLGHFRGLHPMGIPKHNAPLRNPNRNLLLNHLPNDACFVGAWPPALSVPGALPRAFYSVPSPPGFRKSIFCPSRASTMVGFTSTDPRIALSPPGCLSSALLTITGDVLTLTGLLPWLEALTRSD